MIGISISPFVAGLFRNFTTSIFIALGIFAFCMIYLNLFLRINTSKMNQRSFQSREHTIVGAQGPSNQAIRDIGLDHILTSPLQLFLEKPVRLLIGLSLFAYNLVQSYMFTSLLIYTSVQFEFTGRENGFIISIAHLIAALYIFTTLNIGPVPMSCLLGKGESPAGAKWRDLSLACISLTMQTVSLGGLGLAKKYWHLYIATVFLSLGLPASSFIKAYFTSNFRRQERPLSIAALAGMEILGSILSPVLFGSLQVYFTAAGSVFHVAAGITAASLVMLIIGACVIKGPGIVAAEEEVGR